MSDDIPTSSDFDRGAPDVLAPGEGKQALRQVRRWLCPWARLRLYWQSWSTAPPPPELAALLEHVAHSRPLDAPT